jgi:hypothetical protein
MAEPVPGRARVLPGRGNNNCPAPWMLYPGAGHPFLLPPSLAWLG